MSEFFILQFNDQDGMRISIQNENRWVELFTEMHVRLIKEII